VWPVNHPYCRDTPTGWAYPKRIVQGPILATLMAASKGSSVPSTSLAGCTILVIEDEPLIALDIAATCENAGAKALFSQTRNEAERLIETDGISAAVVDLWNDNANALCDRLQQRGIPFVMHSAYANFQDGSDAVKSAAVVPKPATSQALLDALRGALAISRREPVA
jgi:DNA-binding NtrC family response regulator